MTDVYLEKRRLNDGAPMLYRANPTLIRAAYDPHQITEDTALTLLQLQLPHLEDSMILHRT